MLSTTTRSASSLLARSFRGGSATTSTVSKTESPMNRREAEAFHRSKGNRTIPRFRSSSFLPRSEAASNGIPVRWGGAARTHVCTPGTERRAAGSVRSEHHRSSRQTRPERFRFRIRPFRSVKSPHRVEARPGEAFVGERPGQLLPIFDRRRESDSARSDRSIGFLLCVRFRYRCFGI